MHNNIQDLNTIVFDSKKVSILKATDHEGKELKFHLQNDHEFAVALGIPLVVEYHRKLNKDEDIKINLHFSTTPESDAIQWVSKESTISKVNKFMYMQCEPILGRTFFPCQVYIQILKLLGYSICKSNS